MVRVEDAREGERSSRSGSTWQRWFLLVPWSRSLANGRRAVLFGPVWRHWSQSARAWIYAKGERPSSAGLRSDQHWVRTEGSSLKD